MSCCLVDADYTLYDGSRQRFWTHWVEAEKAHCCDECGGVIPKGEKYERIKLFGEGGFLIHRTCPACVEIRRRFCCSYFLGYVLDDIAYSLIELDIDIEIGDVDGLSPGAVERFSSLLDHVWESLDEESEG